MVSTTSARAGGEVAFDDHGGHQQPIALAPDPDAQRLAGGKTTPANRARKPFTRAASPSRTASVAALQTVP